MIYISCATVTGDGDEKKGPLCINGILNRSRPDDIHNRQKTLQRIPPVDLRNERPRVPLARSPIRSASFVSKDDQGTSFGHIESSGDV
jgi:hypothetical protein